MIGVLCVAVVRQRLQHHLVKCVYIPHLELLAAQFAFTDIKTVRTMTMTYSVQIDGLVRDATADETKAIDADRAQYVADKKTNADAQTAKDAARQAVLDKLGLTADEAQALLG